MFSIKKSLARKTIAVLFLFIVIVAAVEFFFRDMLTVYLGVYLDFVWYGVIFIIVSIVILFTAYRPLHVIFREMKAFLTSKPYKRIFTKRIDEVGVLAHFFNEVTAHFERISVQVAEGKRILEELSVGSDIQRKIIPKIMPQISGLSIFGNMRPASEVGGDSFDIITSPSHNTFIYVGDVTGHGVPAALIMMMVNTMIRTLSEIYGSGYEIMVNTNRILKQRIEPRRFMTCVLLRWNSSEQKLYYTGAGHEHILIFRKRTGTCEVKQTGGIALGMVADVSKIIKEELVTLETGDSVVLYSDGIIEAKNMNGEQFGLKRLQNVVQQYGAIATPEELFRHISKEFAAFVGEQMQEDDITLIAVQRM